MTFDPAKHLTTEQRNNLHRLEMEIFAAQKHGRRGSTTSAIEAMRDEEKRLGVHDPRNTQFPRWPKVL